MTYFFDFNSTTTTIQCQHPLNGTCVCKNKMTLTMIPCFAHENYGRLLHFKIFSIYIIKGFHYSVLVTAISFNGLIRQWAKHGHI